MELGDHGFPVHVRACVMPRYMCISACREHGVGVLKPRGLVVATRTPRLGRQHAARRHLAVSGRDNVLLGARSQGPVTTSEFL